MTAKKYKNYSIFSHVFCSKKQPLTIALINVIVNCLKS